MTFCLPGETIEKSTKSGYEKLSRDFWDVSYDAVSNDTQSLKCT